MAKVERWFDDFAALLVQRLPRHDWPPAGTEYWANLYRRFVHHGLREAEADAASALLADAPPAHLDRVWPELLAAVRALRESRGRSAQATPPTFDAARAESRGCPWCGGEGRATAFHPTVAYQPFAAACVCAAGRFWLASLDPADAARALRLVVESDPRGGEVARALTPSGREYPLDPPPLETLTDAGGVPLPEVWARRAAARDRPRVPPAPPPAAPAPAPAPAPAAALAPAPGSPSDSVGVAVQFLVGVLSVRPSTREDIAESAGLMSVSMAAVDEAAARINVLKNVADGQEIWSLEEWSLPRES